MGEVIEASCSLKHVCDNVFILHGMYILMFYAGGEFQYSGKTST